MPIDLEEKMLLEMNKAIHGESKLYQYHMEHIKLVKKYAILINKRLGGVCSNRKLAFIAMAHDILKERSLDVRLDGNVNFMGHNIPQDLNRYVRSNLETLEKFKMDEYFNTDVQLHALSAALFMYLEFGISDPEIIYPIMFHSCPIIDVYETLSPKIQRMVDIIMLSDKLSSNYLRINLKESEVRIDLDQAVFGSNGYEFNYTLGLYLARLIAQGRSTESESVKTTDHYYKRLSEINPMISKTSSIRRMGVNKKWPKRKSQAWRQH